MGLSGSALKPGKSEQTAQGLPAIDADPGQGLQGRRRDRSPLRSKAPEGIQKSTADKTVCAS